MNDYHTATSVLRVNSSSEIIKILIKYRLMFYEGKGNVN